MRSKSALAAAFTNPYFLRGLMVGIYVALLMSAHHFRAWFADQIIMAVQS